MQKKGDVIYVGDYYISGYLGIMWDLMEEQGSNCKNQNTIERGKRRKRKDLRELRREDASFNLQAFEFRRSEPVSLSPWWLIVYKDIYFDRAGLIWPF